MNPVQALQEKTVIDDGDSLSRQITYRAASRIDVNEA